MSRRQPLRQYRQHEEPSLWGGPATVRTLTPVAADAPPPACHGSHDWTRALTTGDYFCVRCGTKAICPVCFPDYPRPVALRLCVPHYEARLTHDMLIEAEHARAQRQHKPEGGNA